MKRLSPFAVAICLCLLSCQKEKTEGLKQIEFNKTFTTKPSERVLLNGNNSLVILELQTIIDRRCSNHSSCEDYGEGIAKVSLSNADNSVTETMLSLGNYGNPTDTVYVKLDKKFYSVVLTGIYPKPCDKENADQPKTANFLIRELK